MVQWSPLGNVCPIKIFASLHIVLVKLMNELDNLYIRLFVGYAPFYLLRQQGPFGFFQLKVLDSPIISLKVF